MLAQHKPGVYLVYCSANNATYVGSSKDVEKRLSDHKSMLRHAKHKQPILQATFNKYGEASFLFIPLAYCATESEYLELEQQVLDSLISGECRTMNIASVTANPRLGRPGRKENGVHVGKSNIGVPKTAEHRAKTSVLRKAWLAKNLETIGSRLSKETLDKMSKNFHNRWDPKNCLHCLNKLRLCP